MKQFCLLEDKAKEILTAIKEKMDSNNKYIEDMKEKISNKYQIEENN